MKEPFHESNRLLFTKVRSNRLGRFHRVIGFVLGVLLLGVGAFYSLDYLSVLRYQAGYQAGLREAINPRNPSQELELACAGLWIGEQNKKYEAKRK